MSDPSCSECGGRLIRCRIPGTVSWGWRCPVHGVVEPKAKPSVKASKKTEANEA